MLTYRPFTEDAVFVEKLPFQYAISFSGIEYRATENVTALGVLLFGLRPRGINFQGTEDPSVAMQLMQHAAYILHLHANGDRHTADGFRRISEADLARWIESAAELAPTAEAADFVRVCIDEALGPFAYLSDEDFLQSTSKGRA